jgi:hypothetical protein
VAPSAANEFPAVDQVLQIIAGLARGDPMQGKPGKGAASGSDSPDLGDDRSVAAVCFPFEIAIAFHEAFGMAGSGGRVSGAAL